MSGDARHENKALMGIFVGLVVLIVVLAGVIVGVNVMRAGQFDDNEVGYDDFMKEVGDEMGVDDVDVIPAPTKANIFSQSIKDRLSDGSRFEVDDATAAYENVYKEANGDVKFYLAVEYAQFLRDYTSNYGRGINALLEVEDMAGERTLYYELMSDLYARVGNDERVKYYDDIVYRMNQSNFSEAKDGDI